MAYYMSVEVLRILISALPFASISPIHRLKKFMSKSECRGYEQGIQRMKREYIANDQTKRVYAHFRYMHSSNPRQFSK